MSRIWMNHHKKRIATIYYRPLYHRTFHNMASNWNLITNFPRNVRKIYVHRCDRVYHSFHWHGGNRTYIIQIDFNIQLILEGILEGKLLEFQTHFQKIAQKIGYMMENFSHSCMSWTVSVYNAIFWLENITSNTKWIKKESLNMHIYSLVDCLGLPISFVLVFHPRYRIIMRCRF